MGRRPSAHGGVPLGGEENFCFVRRPLRGGGHLCREEASARRRPSVQGGGPPQGEENLCSVRRSLRGGNSLCV